MAAPLIAVSLATGALGSAAFLRALWSDRYENPMVARRALFDKKDWPQK